MPSHEELQSVVAAPGMFGSGVFGVHVEQNGKLLLKRCRIVEVEAGGGRFSALQFLPGEYQLFLAAGALSA